MNNLEELGLDSTVIEAVEAQEVKGAFEPLASGVYKAKLKEVATFVTASGAGMLKVVVKPDSSDQEVTVYQNIKKKDGSANEIGQATFRHILDATATDASSITVKTEEIVAYGKKVQGKVVKGLDTKPITAFVRSVFEEGAKFETYNEIEAYGRADGTNSKGEDLVATYKEKIEKQPILNRKAKASTGGGNANTQATTTADGGNVDDLL